MQRFSVVAIRDGGTGDAGGAHAPTDFGRFGRTGGQIISIAILIAPQIFRSSAIPGLSALPLKLLSRLRLLG